METTEFIAKVIITVMDDDPAKIIEAQDDAKMMIELGADFGTSRASLMGEYALAAFKRVNTTTFPELNTLDDDGENKVIDIIAEHIVSKGW